MRKLLILNILFILAVSLTACGKNTPEEAAPTPTPVTQETTLSISQSPYVSLLPTNLARTLIIKTENLNNFTEGNYELLYQAKQGERGIIGKLIATNGIFTKKGLDLGSRSRGTFRPDSNVTGGELTIRFHDDKRSKTVSEFAIYGQVKPNKLLLPDSQTVLAFTKAPSGSFILMDTSGLPTALTGYSPVSRSIGIFSSATKFTAAKLTIPFTSTDDQTQLVVLTTPGSGKDWVEVKSITIAAKQATFPISVGGVYLVATKIQ